MMCKKNWGNFLLCSNGECLNKCKEEVEKKGAQCECYRIISIKKNKIVLDILEKERKSNKK